MRGGPRKRNGADAATGIIPPSGRRVPTKRRLKVTITKIRRERVTLPTAGFAVPCPVCQRVVEILNPPQAAPMVGVGEEAPQALLASGEIHEIWTASGSVAVCKDSLWQRQLTHKTRAAARLERPLP